jgi:hypothetical protein
MAEEKFISGEEFKTLKSKNIKNTSNDQNNKKILWGVAAVAYTLVVFFIGVSFQKGQSKTIAASTTNTQGGGFGGGRGGFANRLFGTVTAVSPTSITVQNARTGGSTTVTITSSTTVSANQQTVSISSIAVGNTVMIALNPSNTSAANSISIVSSPPTSSTSGSSTGL